MRGLSVVRVDRKEYIRGEYNVTNWIISGLGTHHLNKMRSFYGWFRQDDSLDLFTKIYVILPDLIEPVFQAYTRRAYAE